MLGCSWNPLPEAKKAHKTLYFRSLFPVCLIKKVKGDSMAKWSKDVQETSAAQYLPEGLFKKSPKDIAEGLKKAVKERYEKQDLDPSDEYKSAMSMLDFYINRAGKNLSDEDRKRLEKAKSELKNLFGRA